MGVKCINISDLPHLHFIWYHSSDYYRRVLAWERTHNSEKDREQIVPPEILTKNRTTVYYKRSQCNSFNFFTSTENVNPENHRGITNDSTCIANSKCRLATNEFDGKILIIDKELEKGDLKESKLDLDQESINSLTMAVEEEIFQYIKITIERLNGNMKEGQGHLDKLIMTGNAILKKWTGHQSPPQNIPDIHDIFEKLDNFHEDGIIGFGAGDCIIYVFALVRERNNEEKRALKNKIDENVKGLGRLKMIWFDKSPFSCFTKAGDPVISESKITEYRTKTKGYGAVGACGRTGNKDVFTTAGHVFPGGKGEEAFVIDPASSDSADQSAKPIRIGICKAHLGYGENSADFAVVEIDENSTKTNKTIGMLEPFNSPIPVHLYKEQPGNLVDELVHKIGPSSSRTDGVIYIDPYKFSGSDQIKKRNYVIVKGKDEHPFAKPGDSGAVVFRIQFENGKPRAEIISTILCGSIESEKGEEFVVTHRLDEALQELAEQEGMVVNFDDTQ